MIIFFNCCVLFHCWYNITVGKGSFAMPNKSCKNYRLLCAEYINEMLK